MEEQSIFKTPDSQTIIIDNAVFLGTIPNIVVEYLDKLHLNLSHYWALIVLLNKVDVALPPTILATLDRKNYALNGNITESGVKLVNLLSDYRNIPDIGDIKKELKKVKAEHDTKFIEWWDTYPVGNAWKDDAEHGNKMYPGSRGFKTKKDECEKLYLKALAEGTKHEDMLGAIKYEVNEKKREARRTGQNKLDYMVNTHSYLLNKLYINFIEMMKLDTTPGKNSPNKPESTGFTTMLV